MHFSIDGPVRDVIVCHCNACREATGGPWAASAAYRSDLTVSDESALSWERAAVSEHGASRGRCRFCGTVVFWDAPARETVSFAAATLAAPSEITVAAKIWCETSSSGGGTPTFPAGLPESFEIRWVE